MINGGWNKEELLPYDQSDGHRASDGNDPAWRGRFEMDDEIETQTNARYGKDDREEIVVGDRLREFFQLSWNLMIVSNGLKQKAAPWRGHNIFAWSWFGSGFERIPVPGQLPLGLNEDAEIGHRWWGGDIDLRPEKEVILTEEA